LDITAGKFTEARRTIDESLANHRSSFNASSVNQLLSLRTALASNLQDFLTNAQRMPAGFSWNDDGREIPTELKEVDESERPPEGKKLLDIDAAKMLNEQMPLSILKQAAMSKTLEDHLRRDLVQATWLRAVLLGDYKTADELVPILNGLVPNISTLTETFTSASQPDEKKFAALYTWLKFPGLEPIVDSGVGRTKPLNQQDTYRDNWWCISGFDLPPPETDTEKPATAEIWTLDTKGFPVFLTDAQRAAATKEFQALRSLGAAPNFLCRQVLQWATAHPDDARVPEALHLAVKTTRYGCTNKETGRWSKAAYDFLHKRYPRSSWAKQTPYWFKD
jgi:hypothetical protein